MRNEEKERVLTIKTIGREHHYSKKLRNLGKRKARQKGTTN